MSELKVNKKSRHMIKDDKWHILNRPGMYVGSITESKYQEYLIVNGVMQQVELFYSPALVKIINEVIDNSVDILKNSKGGKLSVDLSQNSIKVSDNGSGIPVELIEDLDGTHILTPKAMWGKAKAGSNFNGDALDATTIGTNGVGSFCTNVLSTKFIGTTCDGKKEYIGTWSSSCEDNDGTWEVIDSDYTEVINTKTVSGTSVYFEPNFKRFGLQGFSADIARVIQQRLINLSIVYPNITFSFNGKDIKFTRKEFMAMIGQDGNIYEDEHYVIGVFPSTTDDFSCFSIVNGLNLKGGSHIEYVLKYVQNEIKDKLPKKFEDIKPGDIKNKLKIVFIGNEFPELEWEGQTKESIKNPDRQIRAYLGEDWKDILPKIAKNKAIIEPITFLYAAKIDAEEKRAAKDADKELKKIKVLKLRHASKTKKFLSLTEGDSALKGIIKALGREVIGYLPLRGVVANVMTNKLSSIMANAEYKDIMNTLGLKFSDKNTCKDMLYEYVVITTDADVDGSHIQGLLLGFFYKFVPDIFTHKKILILRTPIKVAKDAKENMVAAFLDEGEYQAFIKVKANEKYTVEYKKGLGSLNPKEYEQFFKLRPFNECLVEINYTEDDFALMEKWLFDDADFRKEKIQERIKDYNIDVT
jgi:DNA gyrase/topoisomerase IV subunit B